MAIKKWEAEYNVLFDASHVVKVQVEANTERKAKIKAEEKIMKMNKGHFPQLISIREIK